CATPPRIVYIPHPARLSFPVTLAWCRILLLPILSFFFFNDTSPPEIYTLSLHDALPIFQFQLDLQHFRFLTVINCFFNYISIISIPVFWLSSFKSDLILYSPWYF